MKQDIRRRAMVHAVAMGLWTFLLTGLSSLLSQAGAEWIDLISIGLGMLLLVIALGVLFDVIGVAVTVAQAPHLHAKASRGIPGATHGLWLVNRSHQVASFCNDVVGDISGTLSGAIGVTLTVRLLHNPGVGWRLIVGTTVMTALIAALTVGGKAFGKVFAIEQATEIVFRLGQFLAWLDRWVPLSFMTKKPKRGRSSRS